MHWNKSFPFVKQRDAMQCGVACLTMICRYYGDNTGIGRLDKLCRPTVEGVSMKAIADAAGDVGIQTAGIRRLEKILDTPPSALLRWGTTVLVIVSLAVILWVRYCLRVDI